MLVCATVPALPLTMAERNPGTVALGGIMEHFCVCGRIVSQCDGSRSACWTNKPGAHHLTDENIAATIVFLEDIERGGRDVMESWDNLDARTFAGILARQLRHLRGIDA